MSNRRLIGARAVTRGMKLLRAKGLVLVMALSLTGAAACLMPAAAENANAGSIKPAQSYKMPPSESSAWP